MSIERRRDLRVAVRGAYAELFLGPASVGLFMIGDVSDSGIFLMTPSPTIPGGTRVTARLEDGLVLHGMIVHVSTTGHTGYGIELDDPPYDTVERVAAPARAPAAVP
ncbi:MAG TPA: PilZ domain-containing protein, partial [Myxococcota bacterium]